MTNELKKSSRTFEQPEKILSFFGPQNLYFEIYEEELPIHLSLLGNTIYYQGTDESVMILSDVLTNLEYLYDRHVDIKQMDIINGLRMGKMGLMEEFVHMYEKEIVRSYSGEVIRAKSLGQMNYIQSIKKHDIVLGIGPAGTGKTFLAVCMAVAALKKGIVKRIILARPAVEAGESLGFLPGDLKEKVDPYLRPLYDALYAVLGKEHVDRLLERETIEIAPLAYMRGRTLDHAFIILDEAQNTTRQQMKMFLTRLGFDSKMVINGDSSQIDLPHGQKSGLIDASHILKGVDGIKAIYFDKNDVVRHPLVASIIQAYEQENKTSKNE